MTNLFDINRMRRLVKRLTAIGLGLFAGLVVVEISLWIVLLTPLWNVLPVVTPQTLQSNLTSGTELISDTEFVWPVENRVKVRINSYGLRDKDLELDETRTSTRVALTGDSIVEALQVKQSQTMDTVAEERLRQIGHEVEIVNLGLNGHGPLRQLVRLEDIGLKLGPEIVISLASAGDFLTGELLSDAGDPGYVPGPGGTLVRGETYKRAFSRRFADKWQGKTLQNLRRYSSLFRVVFEMRNRDVTDVLGLPDDDDADTAAVDTCSTNRLTSLHGLWVDHLPEQHWRAAVMFFDEFSQSVTEAGAIPIYALRDIPDPPDSCQSEQRLRTELIDAVSQYLMEHEIKFVDWDLALLNSELFKSSGLENLSDLQGFGTNLGTGHFNPLGHEVNAEVLTEVILSELANKR